jgi:hypothetical protein
MLARSLALSSCLLVPACGGGSPSPMAPSTPSPSPTPPPAAGPLVLRSATIQGSNGHRAQGRVEVVNDAGAFRLEFGSDFQIDTGSIDIYLSRQTDRVTAEDLNLGNLRSTSGAQSYVLPHDGSTYSHVLLWCRPFRIPIAVGELR